MAKHFEKHPDTWIKVWVGIGLLALVGIISVLTLLQNAFQGEIQRYSDCLDGKRKDCQNSFYWILQRWSPDLITSNSGMISNGVTSDTTAIVLPGEVEATRASRSSESAPQIVSVQPQGMALSDGWYRATAGTVVKVKAQVTGAKTVELYLVPKGTETANLARKVATMVKQSDGGYLADFKVTNSLLGDLEVRATNAKKEISSLFLNVAAQ